MFSIVTPRKLSQRAELYHQLGSLLSAGIPLLQAFDTLRATPGARDFHTPLERMTHAVQEGATFSDSLQALGRWMPEFDLALLSAGEKSGRLDACLRLLADYYSERARLLRSVMADLAYPVFILHLAVLIFPPILLKELVWDGKVWEFFVAKVVLLVPLYAGVFAVIALTQGRHGERWRALIERLVRGIPVLGTARRNLALARLSAALESLLSAGVSIIEAWELAAAASGSPALRRAVLAWRPNVEAGQTPSEVVRQSREFPEVFASLYHSGEISGQLDETLKRLYRLYQEEGSRQLKAVAQWTPRLIYFLILIAAGYQVIRFWTSYYSNMLNQF